MADLSDDLGDALAWQIKNASIEATRNLIRNLMEGDEVQRRLAAQLREWQQDYPQDPFVPIRVTSERDLDSLVSYLRQYGFDARVFRGHALGRSSLFVCVHKSQLSEAMRVAIELGVKDSICEPTLRQSLVVDCGTRQAASEVAEALATAGIDCSRTRSRPEQVVAVVSERERATMVTILAERGIASPVNERGGGAQRTSGVRETGYAEAMAAAMTPEEDFRSRPATQRQMDCVNRMVSEGQIPAEAREALGDSPTVGQVNALLNLYHFHLDLDKKVADHARSNETRAPEEREISAQEAKDENESLEVENERLEDLGARLERASSTAARERDDLLPERRDPSR